MWKYQVLHWFIFPLLYTQSDIITPLTTNTVADSKLQMSLTHQLTMKDRSERKF